MRAWAEMFDDFLAAARRRGAVHRARLLRVRRRQAALRRRAAPARRAAASSCPRATRRRPADAETVCGLGNRKNDAVRRGARAATASTPYPGSVALLDAPRRARHPDGRRVELGATPRTCSRAAGLARPLRDVVDGGRRRARPAARQAARPTPSCTPPSMLGVRPTGARRRRGRRVGRAGRARPATSGSSSASTAASAPTRCREHGADVVVADLAELVAARARRSP